MRQTNRLFLCLAPVILIFILAAAVTSRLPGQPPVASADSQSATWEVQSDCTETSPLLTRKTYVVDGLAGSCATPSGATQPGLPLSGVDNDKQLYAYFDVSDSYMYKGNYKYAQIDVEYFDGAYAADGNTRFTLDYDASSSASIPAYTPSAQAAFLNNSQTYVTTTFYLTDVNFANLEHAGTDFRLGFLDPATNVPLYLRKITVTRSATSLAPSYAAATSVSYQAPTAAASSQGLYLVNAGSDGHTSANSS
ncbi:MAG: hypothetical protein Q7T05_08175, partial [Dehalococcoidia bacterium]|nr:hypothetical protein [Dehalococcoidia bacterium]